MGKPLSEAVGEAEFCGDIFDYFATEGPTLAADQPIKTFSGGKAVVQKLPIGAAARHHAVELPLLPDRPLRGAEPDAGQHDHPQARRVGAQAPRSRSQQLMKDAGVPDGAYVNVFASHDQIETIIADPRIAGVSLTGSERAGAVVAAIAGKNLKKCVLELGGSDPYVVLDTDDVEGAADTAWDTRISNTGQACNSNKRMIVMDDVFDGFVARLTEHAKDLRPGDPTPRRRARSRRSRRGGPRRPWPSRWTTPSARARRCTPAACSATVRRRTTRRRC